MRRDRGNGRRRAAVVLAAALGVSACAAGGGAPAPETAPPPAAAAEVSEPVAEIAVAPEPEPAPEPAAAEPAAPAPTEPPAEPPPEPAPEPVEETVARLAPPPEPEIDDDPEQVIGLDPGALEALLGAPGFVREDADAQVWQYRGADCVLDAFLYSDGLAEPFRVTYYEIRGDAGDDRARRRCFRSLLPERKRG